MGRLILATCLVVVISACASNAPPPDRVGTADDGRGILERTCTVCHDLGGLPAFADYWGEPEWRSMIDTMVSYGATLSPSEYEVLARYLADNY